MEAFLRPALYVKLMERYRGAPVPEAQHLANVLNRDYGLLETVAPFAAEAFLESLEFVGLIVDGNVSPAMREKPAGEKNGEKPPHRDPPPPTPPSDFIQHQFQLRRDMRIVLPLPPDLTHADVERLARWMKTLPLEPEEPGIG